MQTSGAESHAGQRIRTIARALPFILLAVASVWAAGKAPDGRHAPQLDWSLDGDSILAALTKWPHLIWTAVLFCLAVLAVRPSRLGLAAALTVVVGVAWELAETTVVGHHARLVDLVPDLAAIAVTCALAAALRATLSNRQPTH